MRVVLPLDLIRASSGQKQILGARAGEDSKDSRPKRLEASFDHSLAGDQISDIVSIPKVAAGDVKERMTAIKERVIIRLLVDLFKKSTKKFKNC